MNAIQKRLSERRAAQQTGLIVYLTAGCPDYAATQAAIIAAAAAGADVIEIGVPFSDPMADGPVIQEASTKALAAGATLAKTLQLVRDVRQQTTVPLALMTYCNPVLQAGTTAFCQAAAAAGVDGLIVPDLPLEEAGLLQPACQAAGLAYVPLIAPTSTPERVRALAQSGNGFIYLVATAGVTGVREMSYEPLAPLCQAVRQATDVPLAIGFGIGTPTAARAAAQQADAVIIGSAVMACQLTAGPAAVGQLVATLRQALDSREETA